MKILHNYNLTSMPCRLLGLLSFVLFLNFGCGKCKKQVHTETEKGTDKRNTSKPKKPLLQAKVDNTAKGDNYYVFVMVKPQTANTDPSQYFLRAQTLAGQGHLLGAQEKKNQKFQYDTSLDKEQCIANLLPDKGNQDAFKSGKQLRLKCKYEPDSAAQPGEKHRIMINLRHQDRTGKTSQEEQAEVNLTIKKPSHQQSKTDGSNQPKKPLVQAKIDNSAKGDNHYVFIMINPQAENTALSQYFVCAQAIKRQGKLLGARAKKNQKFQYNVSLEQGQCLTGLLPDQGNQDEFKAGKQLRLKCKYEPIAGAQQGDTHQIFIEVRQHMNDGEIIAEEAIIDVPIKQTINR